MADACVIFDIDGTLVDSVAFDARCFVAAVRDVLGDVSIRSNWSYEHITDAGILRQICEENGVDPAQYEHPVKARFGELIASHLRRQDTCLPILRNFCWTSCAAPAIVTSASRPVVGAIPPA